jgi:predicted signal transduction protein with EAL and GGDEF domain
LKHIFDPFFTTKTEGRGTYRFFEATMDAELRDRRILEHDLRHAIARSELSLVYQPQTDIKTYEITGFEALLRWQHPTRGAIPPAVFIPVAEDSGAILQIGEWVLRAACTEAAGWTRPLRVAVNVSAVQLHNVNFSHQVHEILVQTGLPPHRLELEITETAFIRDLKRALSTLRQLKALGVRIAMDDRYRKLVAVNLRAFRSTDQDRRLLHQVRRHQRASRLDRARRARPGRGLGLPVLAEVSRRPANSNFFPPNCATRPRATCSACPPVSSSFGISRTAALKAICSEFQRHPHPRKGCASSANNT